MIKMDNIEGALVDYGGTIDTNGRHWAVVFFEQYLRHGIPVSREEFYKAYVFAERKMAMEPIIKRHFTFEDVLKVKIAAQMQYLQFSELYNSIGLSIVDSCCTIVEGCIEDSKSVLMQLKARYKLVMVSNFYGNLENVLDGYGLLGYFDTIVESARVGVRKPDPAIYRLGIDALQIPAIRCVVIGDSYSKDILPAKACGCKAVWLENEGWEDQVSGNRSAADRIVHSFDSVLDFLL